MSKLVPTVHVFDHQGQIVTTSLHIAKATGLRHDNILRSIAIQKKYYTKLNRSGIFDRDFLLADEQVFSSKLREINFHKKTTSGRKAKVYLLTKEGANAFIGSLTGERACEFRIMLAEAFSVLERQNELLRTENMQLRAQIEITPRKVLRESRKNYLPVLEHDYTLYGIEEVVRYVWRERETLSELEQLKAKDRHLRKMLKGIAIKHDELNERVEALEGDKSRKIIRMIKNESEKLT